MLRVEKKPSLPELIDRHSYCPRKKGGERNCVIFSRKRTSYVLPFRGLYYPSDALAPINDTGTVTNRGTLGMLGDTVRVI